MAYEDFYESAIRHWIDGSILEENEEYDNAVCMQGFAAECALKRIMERICSSSNIRKYSHFGEALFQDIVMMLTGDVAAVEAAIERAKAAVADQGMYLDSSVIAHPDAQIREAIL